MAEGFAVSAQGFRHDCYTFEACSHSGVGAMAKLCLYVLVVKGRRYR